MKVDRVREELLGKRDLDLDKAIEMTKACQVTHSRASEISEEFAASEEINAVKYNLKRHSKGKLRKSPSRRSLPLLTRVPQSLKSVCFVVVYMQRKEILPSFRSKM